MKILRTTDRNFRYDFGKVFKRQFWAKENIIKAVADILDDIKRIGDQALTKYTSKFDSYEVSTRTIIASAKEFNLASKCVTPENKKALEEMASAIEKFYKQQKISGFVQKSLDSEISLITRPLDKVGIYVPGGRIRYASSLFMTAIPAKVAGVNEISLCTPWTNGEQDAATLVAAEIVGIKNVYKIGGAQAIAAMAYGTKTIPKVDKIFGPGNLYVTLAKKMVYGDVDIDMLAGPGELVVFGDGSVEPAHVASDLVAIAEQDELATTLLLTTNSNYAIRVEGEVRKQTLKLEQKNTIGESIKKRGLIVLVRNTQEAIDLINEVAPQHLELCVKDANKLVDKIKNTGSIFVGPHSPKALGDYGIGPSNILPTFGTATFSSVLTLNDFCRTFSVMEIGPKSLQKFGPIAVQIATLEGLTGHARSIEMRLKG